MRPITRPPQRHTPSPSPWRSSRLTFAFQVTTSAQGPDARKGREIFRFDTFGDEQLWTTVLRMHEVLPDVDPVTALGVGLKVDVEALPRAVIDALRADAVDSDGSGDHGGAAETQRDRRRQGTGRRQRTADQRRHHLRALSLDGGRFADARASDVGSTDGRIAI